MGAGYSSIAMCFHPRLQPQILNQSMIFGNKAMWIRFKGLEGGNLGILIVYASNLDGERCAMWNEELQLCLWS